MSGSTGCKYNARTRTQDITNERAAEIIELAAILTNHPDVPEASAALARIADELLETGSDAIINWAIKAAPSCAIAQTLRHAVEAASERVVVYRNGTRAEFLLFAIPILTTFEQNVPESQLESALSGLCGEDLANSVEGGRPQLADVVLVPKLFRLNDLGAMPLSVVRERGIDLLTGAERGCPQWHTSTTQKRSFRRSTAFLRFLVGQRKLLEHEEMAATEDGLCEQLQDVTSRTIKRYLRLACRVEAFYIRSFYEGLYSGMWRYQERRLDQLAHASCSQERRRRGVEARVMTYGRGHGFEMWIGFFAGNEAIGGHAYRLSSRPNEDLKECVSRITSRLEAVGIRTTTLTDAVGEERRFGQRARRKFEPSILTIPI